MVIDNVICGLSSSFPSNENKMLQSHKNKNFEAWQIFKSYMQLPDRLENDANTNHSNFRLKNKRCCNLCTLKPWATFHSKVLAYITIYFIRLVSLDANQNMGHLKTNTSAFLFIYSDPVALYPKTQPCKICKWLF